MEKMQRSQLAKMVFFILLLLLIPFTSSSVRTYYLYLILNILVVVLSIEAGLLTASSGHHEEKNTVTAAPIDPILHAITEAPPKNESSTSSSPKDTAQPAEPVEKAIVVKAVAVVLSKVISKVKGCPSIPSLFFISGSEIMDDDDDDDDEEEEEEEEEEVEVVEVEEVADLSGQELFARAEVFIGNFYKQVKMQREESLKKIYGLCNHRAAI